MPLEYFWYKSLTLQIVPRQIQFFQFCKIVERSFGNFVDFIATQNEHSYWQNGKYFDFTQFVVVDPESL